MDRGELELLLEEHNEYEKERGWYSPELAEIDREREVERKAWLLGSEVEELGEEVYADDYSEREVAYELADVLMFNKGVAQAVGADPLDGIETSDGFSPWNAFFNGGSSIQENFETIRESYDTIDSAVGPDWYDEETVAKESSRIMSAGADMANQLDGDFTRYFREKMEINHGRHRPAVIEMTWQDEWWSFTPLPVNLDVPVDASALVDFGGEKYELYGRTDDFETLQPVDEDGRDIDVELMKEVISRTGGPATVRTVLMDDGRVFTNQVDNEEYLEALEGIIGDLEEYLPGNAFKQTAD